MLSLLLIGDCATVTQYVLDGKLIREAHSQQAKAAEVAFTPRINLYTNQMEPPIISELGKHAKYKERSDKTHDLEHAPVLAQKQPITCLLLGHSFFERFKTTGSTTVFGPDQAPYPEYFNAGVGGDRICNVIYRLTEKGLLMLLKEAGFQYTLLAIGTNDLADDKRPLQAMHIEQYRLVIKALQWACPDVKILVCGIAPKKRVKREGIVEESNDMIEKMVQEFAEGDIKSSVVEYLPSDPELIDNLEPDGVHLNTNGYEMFAESLWKAYQALRTKNEPS